MKGRKFVNCWPQCDHAPGLCLNKDVSERIDNLELEEKDNFSCPGYCSLFEIAYFYK